MAGPKMPPGHKPEAEDEEPEDKKGGNRFVWEPGDIQVEDDDAEKEPEDDEDA